MGVPAALAPTGVSVSHPKERLDGHALTSTHLDVEVRSTGKHNPLSLEPPQGTLGA
jgi:hypothetical protein